MKSIYWATAVCAALFGVGCGPAQEFSDEDLGSTTQAGKIAVNGLSTINGLTTANGLGTVNGLTTANGLSVVNGLSSVNGLTTANGFTAIDGLREVDSAGKPTVFPNGGALMNSASGRNLISYITKCALTSAQSIVRKDTAGVSYTFKGALGLAPEWYSTSNAACGLACEEWVSACLLAHFNANGVHQNFVMVASHPAIGWGNPDDDLYEEKEAGFYGNLFMSPPKAYYCASILNDAELDSRTCADNGQTSACPMTPMGECTYDWPDGGAYTPTGVEFDEVTDNDCDDGYCMASARTTLPNTCGPNKNKMCVSQWTRVITTWVEDD